jgi:hypothetical protein
MASVDFSWIEANAPDFRIGGAGALMRAHDWSKAPLALIEICSSSLRMMICFLLTIRNGTAAGNQ